jgi:hypothetical protein
MAASLLAMDECQATAMRPSHLILQSDTKNKYDTSFTV